MINADVLTGTTDAVRRGCLFNPRRAVLPRGEQIAAAQAFIGDVLAALPHAILSLGWTTVAHPASGQLEAYTPEMVDDMEAVVRDFVEASVPLTFAVKMAYVQPSWDLLKARLLDPAPMNTLTVWSHSPPSRVQRAWFAAALDGERSMFDVGDHPTDAAKQQRVVVVAMGAWFVLAVVLVALTK